MSASRAMRRAWVWLPLLAVVALLAAANIAAYRHLGRIDLTSGRVYSLGEDSLRAARAVGQPVSVTWYHDLRNKSMVDAMDLLRQYARANGLISVRGRDPALHPADARRDGISFAGSAVFESGGRRLVVHGGTETDFTNALIRVSRETVQDVCFTQGHREADPHSLQDLDDLEEHDEDDNVVARVEVHEQHGLSLSRNALETLGLQSVALLPGQLDGGLARCAAVVVAGPRQPFLPADAQALRGWVAGGGRALVLLEPGHAHGLDGLLQDFGIDVEGGPVRDAASHYRNDPESPAVAAYPRHRLTRDLPLTFFPGAAALAPAARGLPADVRVTPLVQTSASARLSGAGEPGVRTLAVLAQRDLDAPGPADQQAPARAVLMVVGDSDFATNRHFATLGNGRFFTQAVSFLAEQQDLVQVQPRHYEPARVALSNRQMRVVFWLSTVLMPLLALSLAAVVWWRRR